MRKTVLCLMLCLCCLPTLVRAGDAPKDELTDPVKILTKTDAACKAVRAVRYDVTVEILGEKEPKAGKYEATVTMAGYVQGRAEKFAVDATATGPDSKEPRRISGGSDGDKYYVIDHQAKKAYEDMDVQVLGSFGSTLAVNLMIEFVAEKPFTDEINGQSQELKGSKAIGGEDCYVIRVVYADSRAPAATWLISKKDFLPRGRIDEFTTQDGQELRQAKLLSKLVVDPKLEKDTFALKLPEGYTKTDDFAP